MPTSCSRVPVRSCRASLRRFAGSKSAPLKRRHLSIPRSRRLTRRWSHSRRRAHIEQAIHTASFDPREIERIEERLFALRAASRKYNVAVDELAALAARYAGDLAVLDAGAEALVGLERSAREAEARYREGAEA